MPAIAYRANQERSLDAPASKVTSITPHDTNELTYLTRGIWVGSISGGAAVKVTTEDGDVVTFSGCIAGTVIPVRAKIVWSAGTTASSLLALH